MYNTNIKLTYHNIVGDTSDTTYRKELLDVFQIDINCFNQLNDKIDEIYKLLPNDNLKWNQILEKSASKFLSNEKDMGFMILFSYDTFHIVHRLLCDFFQTNHLNDNILQELEDNVK